MNDGFERITITDDCDPCPFAREVRGVGTCCSHGLSPEDSAGDGKTQPPTWCPLRVRPVLVTVAALALLLLSAPAHATCTMLDATRAVCDLSTLDAVKSDTIAAELHAATATADRDACRAVLAAQPPGVSRWAWLGAGVALGVATVLGVVWAVR